MDFHVLRLYSYGVRLPLEKLRAATPEFGYLEISRVTGTGPLKPSRVARLWGVMSHSPKNRALLPPLYDPAFDVCDSSGLILMGSEFVETRQHKRALVIQGWLLLTPGITGGDLLRLPDPPERG